jgi:hypothetical protein
MPLDQFEIDPPKAGSAHRLDCMKERGDVKRAGSPRVWMAPLAPRVWFGEGREYPARRVAGKPENPSRVLRLTVHATNKLRYFATFGESSGRAFGIDQFAVDVDVENSTAARDQLWVDSEFLFEFGSQTGRLWQVVSLGAVFDLSFHACLSKMEPGLSRTRQRL